MLKIFKGDDTGGTFGRTLEFTIAAADGISLAGCYAEFVFDGIVKTFAAPLVDGETREIFYSHNETKDMRLGVRSAMFRIIDSAGKVRTMDNTVAVKVTNVVAEAYPGSSSATVTIGGAINWGDIEGRPATVVQTINGEEPDENGNVNVTEFGGDMNHADFNELEDATAADTIGALKAKYNALLAICKGVSPVVAMALLLMACGDALALTSATDFDDISGTNTIGEVVKAGGLAASDVHARPDDWMPNAQDVGARPDDWMPTASDVGAVAVGANGGVAIGVGTTAEGSYSHAEGHGTTASGNFSHAEGDSTTASGDASHAEGVYANASGDYSHAEGVKANANENYSFSWNGDESIIYNSHGIGTFNLNPLGGLSGLWIGGLNLATILGGYAKRTGETETVDFRNTRTMVKTQLAPVGEDAVNFDMLVRFADAAASSIATTYVPTNALVSLNQSVQYVTADSNGSAVEILAPTNSMKDWIVYIYTTTNNAVLFPTGTVYAADATVTNALKPNVVTALYLSSYPAVSNGLIVGRQEMNPIVIVR